ncbi:GNAT family N-acetyltransferase [Emticicia sp. 17c]|uniref:GNAT family N-acetyltransferase n=1 Tax=Emticicia sp. 17c TaxID=3127704 RepID=UPI00301C5319
MPELLSTVKCVPFNDLSLNELYEILALRQEVFIVEQNCPFQDADGKDQQAYHFMLLDDAHNLLAYTRLFAYGVYYEGYASIGRVVSSPKARGKGVGRILMQKSIEEINRLFGRVPIKIGAQRYLEDFYQSLGFQPTGNHYIEDGIPHTYMILPAE